MKKKATVENDHISIAKTLQIFLPFAVGYFLSYLYRVINAVLAPNLASDIGVTPAGLGLLTSAYFISFATFQLPLGVLLDQFGPRKIEAALLIVASAGAYVFSKATTLSGLVIGRALIGLGVSACLMAAFKAFVIWFPKQKLPMINGFQMAAGGLGALTATGPVDIALSYTDWRGVFMALSVLTLMVATGIYLIVPERKTYEKSTGISEQLDGIRIIFSSRIFWQIAPWTTLSQCTFMSIQGLWAGMWLRDVAGMDRTTAAHILLVMSTATIVGFITLGTIAERLSRKGIRPMTTASVGMITFLILLTIILFEPIQWCSQIWFLFGFFGTSGILPYAVLSQSFPSQLSGRVNTALNLLVFVMAFASQWGIGAIIGRWSPTIQGRYDPAGYQAAFSIMILLQLIGFSWFLINKKYVTLS